MIIEKRLVQILLFLSITLLTCCKRQKKEVLLDISGQHFQMNIPKGLKEVSSKQLNKKKYRYEERRLSKQYVKEDELHELNLNYEVNIDGGSLVQWQGVYEKAYSSRKIKLLKNEIRQINRSEVLYMKLLVPPGAVQMAPGDEIIHFFVTMINDKVLVGGIRYPFKKDQQYETEALNSINSIRISKR